MRKRLMNNIGLKVLAFFSAVLLWLVVVNIDDPVKEKTYTNIPVTVTNEEVLTQNPDKEKSQTYQIMDGTQTVNVTVAAKRSVLSKIKSEDIIATASMKELTLKTQIPIEIAITDHEGEYEKAYATPRNLQIKLEDEKSSKFPITPTTKGTVRDGYVLGEIKAIPEKVSIRGPESVISQISRVTAEVDVSGLSSDTVIQSALVLYDADNNVIDQALLKNNLGEEPVSVSVQLLHTKNVPVNFDTSNISAADGFSFVKITYEPKEIQIAGSKEDLEKVIEINVPADALDVTDVKSNTEKLVDITSYLPENVKLADENANNVIVTISVEKAGTKSYEVTLSTITVNNLKEDLQMSYGTVDSINVQVRGAKELLDTLMIGKNVKVSIDLEKYKEAGTYDVPVEIQLPEGCTLEKSITVKVVLEKKA